MAIDWDGLPDKKQVGTTLEEKPIVDEKELAKPVINWSGLPDKKQETKDTIFPLDERGNAIPIFTAPAKDAVYLKDINPAAYNRKMLELDKIGRKREWDRLPQYAKSDIIMEKIAKKSLSYLISAPIAPIVWPWLIRYEVLQQAKNLTIPLAQGEGYKYYSPFEDRKLTEFAKPLLYKIPLKAEKIADPPNILKINPSAFLIYKALQTAINNPRATADVGLTVGEYVLDFIAVGKLAKGQRKLTEMFEMSKEIKAAYKTLNLTKGATSEQIRKAGVSAALKYHPDRGGNPETFRVTKEAYDKVVESRKSIAQRIMTWVKGIKRTPPGTEEAKFLEVLGAKQTMTLSEATKALKLPEKAQPLVKAATEAVTKEQYIINVAENPELASLSEAIVPTEQMLSDVYYSAHSIPLEPIVGEAIPKVISPREKIIPSEIKVPLKVKPIIKKPISVELPPPKYKRPTPAKMIISQSRYAELLGVKKIVEPLEIGKMKKDRELGILENQIDRTVLKLKKLKTISTEEMSILINTKETAPKELGEKETQVFNYFRSLTQEVLVRLNQTREITGREPIKGIPAYFRRIANAEAQNIMEGRLPIPEKIKAWGKKNLPSKIYNPMEKERKIKDELLNYFSKDLAYVMKSMVRTALREIHMDVPLKFYKEELAASQRDINIYDKLSPEEKIEYDKQIDMPEETRKWVIDYVDIVLLGERQTKLDAGVNLWVSEGPLNTLLNKVMKPFGKQIGERAFTDLIVGVSKLPLYGVMGPFNPRQLLRNKVQTLQSMALYGTEATTRGYLPVSDFPILQKLKTDSLFRLTYSGIEGMPVSLLSKGEKVIFAAFQRTAASNVSQAMNAAYHWTANKIQNPKFKGHGWADPKRTYKEDKDFMYPSELEKALKEMEYGAHTTQFGYLGMHMPQAFRYKAATGITRLMSWWMNHWGIFQREALTRVFKGHVGYDPTLKVTVADKFNYLQYLIIAGAILNTIGYSKSFMFGTFPTAVPPTAQVAMGIWQYFTNQGDSDWARHKRKEAERMMQGAIWTFLPGYMSIKDMTAFLKGELPLSRYLFYGKKEELRAW